MEQSTTRRAIALGYFDGVHLGHRALMERAVQRAKEQGARSAVFTFDVHPDTIVSGTPVPLITANAWRREEIKLLGGIDEVIFGRFDEAMRTMDWRAFISDLLVKQFGACWLISGHNNRFGYRGLGTPEGMAEECKRLGIGYDCIEDVKVGDIVVSSTYIRQLIAAGEMERAAQFLGHPYTVAGVVSHGRKVGRAIGVPTVNIPLPSEMQNPPYGVYASRVCFGDKAYLAATNIGVHPTFENDGIPTIEPHLLDFAGDLYGQFIRVELHHFLRPERSFDTVEQLKNAIDENIRQTRQLLG